MIVLTGRKIPPTAVQRAAARKARRLRHFRYVCTVAAVLAPFTLALALWLLTRNQIGWGVTAVCLAVPMFVAGYSRLTDVGPKDAP